jgi:CRISPR/Cas system-associated exonuclease Cas4 (RecB family)
MTKTLTGRDVHEAYNKVQLDHVRERGYSYTPTTVNAWEDLSKREKALYERMADNLNKMMEEQEATSFAAGECPNCGNDFTAHSAWIASPGDRTCEEATC